MNPNPTDAGYCPVCGEFIPETVGWNAHVGTHPRVQVLEQPQNRAQRRAAAKLLPRRERTQRAEV